MASSAVPLGAGVIATGALLQRFGTATVAGLDPSALGGGLIAAGCLCVVAGSLRVDEPAPPEGARPAERGRAARLFNTAVFFLLHLLAISLAVHVGVSASALALCAAVSATLVFGITAGFHRYFAHRAYQTSRAFQLVLALLGTLSLQKGVLWWASHHRRHHRESDLDGDVHSPVRRGFWWAHMGWILVPDWEATDLDGIKDMARYPELRWLNRHYLVPPLALSVLVGCTLGAQHLAWGCFMSTMLVGHATFCVNSVAHLVGRRVYETADHSRNNWALALLTGGEGWHNNHHFFPASARQGFRWYEVDTTYYVLCALERLGVVWGLKRPTPEIVAGRLGGKDHLVGGAAGAPAPVVADVDVASA